VELRRRRAGRGLGLFLTINGLILVVFRVVTDSTVSIVGTPALVIGVAALVNSLRHLTVHIGPDGIMARVSGIRRLVPWSEIDQVVLSQTAADETDGQRYWQVLLVPVAGSPLKARRTHLNPINGRPSLLLFQLDPDQHSVDEVATALASYSGGRFVDNHAQRRGPLATPSFTVALRGYECGPVEELISEARTALDSGQGAARQHAKASIDGAALPIGLKGYDRTQVDAYLKELSTALASAG